MSWNEGVVRPVALAALGQRYRRYRLADPPAEEAMAGSLRRWGQLAPVVACVAASSWNCSTASSVWRRRGRWPG